MAARHFNVCRYRRKEYHKRIMIKRFEKAWGSRLTFTQILDKYSHEPWMHREIKYWQTCYLSGPRQYAKYGTDRRIRQKYRINVRKREYEEITAPRHSDYRKEYDYDNTVW